MLPETHISKPANKTPLPITPAAFGKIMPHARFNFLPPLNHAMSRYEINTSRRIAGFLAQLAVESDELRHTHERWSAKKNFHLQGVAKAAHTATSKEDYFNYWYGGRQELGNDQEGDGYKYRGRGAIQITGRENYRLIGVGIGKPLEAQPDLVESDLNVDMLASAYFFARLKHLNAVSDLVDPQDPKSVSHINHKLTRGVNGGVNGQAERLKYFRRALEVLA